jgi:integrase
MRKNITTVVVEHAKVPPGYSQPTIDIWDRTLRGFGLRVGSDKKTWIAMYRFGGKKKRLRLGEYPSLSLAAARTAFKVAVGQIAQGTDPAAQAAAEKAQERDAESLESIADLFLKEHVGKKRDATQRQYRQIVSHLISVWGGRKARDITRADIKVLLADVRARTEKGVMANRTLAVVRKMFGWAVDEDLIQASPAYKVARPVQEQPRERVLSAAEIKALWLGLADQPPHMAAFFKLCLLTCQRRGEILGMAWSEIDLDTGWWIIPGARTKNKRQHRVYLVPAAIEILKDIKSQQQPTSPYLFPGSLGKPIANPQGWILQLKDSGIHARPHDLRRTGSTLMTSAGIRKEIVGRILNHTQAGETSRVYDQYSYDREKQAGLTKLDSIMRRIIEGREHQDDKIVALHG